MMIKLLILKNISIDGVFAQRKYIIRYHEIVIRTKAGHTLTSNQYTTIVIQRRARASRGRNKAPMFPRP